MIFKSTLFFNSLALSGKLLLVGSIVASSTSCMEPATELNYRATVAGYQRGNNDTQTADIKRQSLVPKTARVQTGNQTPAGVILNNPFAYGNALNSTLAPNPIVAQPTFNSSGSSPYGSLANSQENIINPNVFGGSGQNIYQQPAYGNNEPFYNPYNPVRR